MIDTLRKLGVPLTLAAALGAVITTTPLLFTIDERYAKASDVKERIEVLQIENQALRTELARLVGFQSAMVQFIQEGRIPAPSAIEEQPTRMRSARPPSVEAVPPPPLASTEAIAPSAPPIVRMERPPRREVPAPVEGVESPEAPLRNWNDLKSNLERQQERLNR